MAAHSATTPVVVSVQPDQPVVGWAAWLREIAAAVNLLGQNVATGGGGSGSGTVTNIATGTGLTGGPITTTGTISLANTAVAPGSYTHSSITVDAQGRLTAASNGAAGSGTTTTFQSTPANPTPTTQVPGVMAGFAGSITPATPRMFVMITGTYNNNTASRGSFVVAKYGTGTAPAYGVAPVGTSIGAGAFQNIAAANLANSFMTGGIVTGLTPGTPYWLDLDFGSLVGGQTSLFNCTIIAYDLP